MKEIGISPDRMRWGEAAGQDFTMAGHTNTISEQQLVLEGAIQSGGQTFGRGSYRFIPRGGSHEPWTCGEGAVLLVTWD